MRMKQKTKSIVTALLLGGLCAVTLSAVITVPDWETARADLLIGMQYETTGLDLDAVPGWLAALVMLHQNFPLDGWAWGPAAAGLAVLLCWVRGQREAKPKRTELVLSIVFGIAEVLGLSICKLGSWAFVFKNPYQLCVGVFCMAGYAVLFYHAVWGLYALLGRSRTGGEDFPQTRFAAWFAKAPGRASSLLIGAAWLPWVAVFWPGSVDWDSWGQISQVLGVQEMTAHHTVLSTWLHGWLFRLGRALGSDNLGVFLYIVLQFLVCAWVFGQVTAFAARLGCSRGVQYAVTAFFALDPIWGAFIQTQVKDTLYTGLFVLFVLKTADLLLFPQEWQGSRPRLTAYAVLGVLCCLLRKNGIYAVVRAQEYDSYYADNGSLLFIGIFLGSLFLLGTAMIIYYKQISEGYEDQNRFEIMQKVGLSHREVKSSIRRQILMVFFLPLLMAMLHISMAFPLIRRMLLLFGMTNTRLFIGCTAGTVLIFALVYGLIYLMTAKSYYHIVERR